MSRTIDQIRWGSRRKIAGSRTVLHRGTITDSRTVLHSRSAASSCTILDMGRQSRRQIAGSIAIQTDVPPQTPAQSLELPPRKYRLSDDHRAYPWEQLATAHWKSWVAPQRFLFAVQFDSPEEEHWNSPDAYRPRRLCLKRNIVSHGLGLYVVPCLGNVRFSRRSP